MPITPQDSLVFELKQRMTAAMLQVGLLLRTDCYADASLRMDAIEREFNVISVLVEAIITRTGQSDDSFQRAGLAAIVSVEQLRSRLLLAEAD